MYIRPIQTNLFKHFWSSLFSVLHSNKISIKFRSIEIEIRLSFSVSLPPYGFVEATACYTNCQASYVISRVSCRTTLREKGGRGRSFSSSIYRPSIPTSRQQTLLGNNRSLSLSLSFLVVEPSLRSSFPESSAVNTKQLRVIRIHRIATKNSAHSLVLLVALFVVLIVACGTAINLGKYGWK